MYQFFQIYKKYLFFTIFINTSNTNIYRWLEMKLKDLQREQIKTKTMKSSDNTFQQLKVVGAYTQRTQDEVLKDLLKEELKRLNISI